VDCAGVCRNQGVSKLIRVLCTAREQYVRGPVLAGAPGHTSSTAVNIPGFCSTPTLTPSPGPWRPVQSETHPWQMADMSHRVQLIVQASPAQQEARCTSGVLASTCRSCTAHQAAEAATHMELQQ